MKNMKTICIGNGQLHDAIAPMEECSKTLNTLADPMKIIGGGEKVKRVRRLTPTECERLMGFPDGWTDIGEYTDTQGKKRQTTDTPRYKALGNSICTPFWYWLMRRISAQYDDIPTLGSLFDGIGGFPYCWARINGLNACVWASEIEEFPIAVTERHFGEDGDFYKVMEEHEKANR